MKKIALTLVACVLSTIATAEGGLLRSRCSCRGTTSAAPTAPAIGQGTAAPTPVPANREEQTENTNAPKFRDLRVSDEFTGETSNNTGTTATQLPMSQSNPSSPNTGWNYSPAYRAPRSSFEKNSNATRKITTGGVAH